VGRACGTHGRGEKRVQGFGEKVRRRKRPLGRPRRRWKLGVEWFLGRLAEGVEWIHLAQDRDRWRAVVNSVMNLMVLAPRN
jgi:hypothetical protein